MTNSLLFQRISERQKYNHYYSTGTLELQQMYDDQCLRAKTHDDDKEETYFYICRAVQ